jgi:hypothetical protein
MVASLLCLALSLELVPTDDVWVYSHASDQVADPFLRVWGSNGESITGTTDDTPASWSLLSFDLSKLSSGAKLKSAKLVLYQTAKPTFSYEDSVIAPVEVRPVKSGFKEKDWSIADAEDYRPESADNAVYGTAAVKPTGDDQPVRVEVDLMHGKRDFSLALSKAMQGDKRLGLALSSRIEIGASRKTYKFYSRAAEEKLRPRLVLDWEG